jgi:hypothetical protein
MTSLSDFFNVVIEAKIQKEEEFKSLVGDNFFDEIFNEQLKPHKTPEQRVWCYYSTKSKYVLEYFGKCSINTIKWK